jgi:hypothetical protein
MIYTFEVTAVVAGRVAIGVTTWMINIKNIERVTTAVAVISSNNNNNNNNSGSISVTYGYQW